MAGSYWMHAGSLKNSDSVFVLLSIPKLDWIYKKILHEKGSQALERAAQGSGGITISEGV